jgi:prolipoprotein diacylglyceryltransferase
MNLFLVLAFLFSGFIFWKRGKEEHYKEEVIFDGFLLTGIFGVLAARLGFIILNPNIFGLSLFKWLDFMSYPGFNGVIGLIFMALYLYRFAKKNKWDGYEILDFWSLASSLGLAILHIGLFFDSGSFGVVTKLPIGVIFPGSFEPRHPVQLYYALFYFALFAYLQWSEWQYRSFEWYRYGKKTAQTGFLLAMTMILAGIGQVLLSFLKQTPVMAFGVNLELVTGFLAFILGIIILYLRSGRELPFFKKGHHGKIERL